MNTIYINNQGRTWKLLHLLREPKEIRASKLFQIKIDWRHLKEAERNMGLKWQCFLYKFSHDNKIFL